MADELSLADRTFQGIDILEAGLDALCKNNCEAQELIAPRRTEIISLLCAYITEIETHNQALSLVGTDDRQELIQRHILDSLAPLGLFCRLLQERCALKPKRSTDCPHPVPAVRLRIADIGSGAGLPGIPLAIALPFIDFSLIECKGRRAGFLRIIQQALGLSNVTVIEDELEKYAHRLITNDQRNANLFDLITFRAFKPLDAKIMKSLLRLCVPGGAIAAYKGRRKKIDAELAALEHGVAHNKKLQWRRCEVIPCPTPLLAEERHIVAIVTP